ncbi:MAG: hypothetical protein ACLQM8_09600 [Limisphaerales bacterium]
MSWARLRKALQGIRPAGTDGFEGVVATLLEQLLGERFVVARSGGQSGMDARNAAGGSVLQAKR